MRRICFSSFEGIWFGYWLDIMRKLYIVWISGVYIGRVEIFRIFEKSLLDSMNLIIHSMNVLSYLLQRKRKTIELFIYLFSTLYFLRNSIKSYRYLKFEIHVWIFHVEISKLSISKGISRSTIHGRIFQLSNFIEIRTIIFREIMIGEKFIFGRIKEYIVDTLI